MDPQIGLRYLDEFELVPDLLPRLPGLTAPTLIVQGKQDSVIPEETRRILREAIPNARYVEIDGAGHFPCLTDAEAFNRLLCDFLAEHERTDGSRLEGARKDGRSAGRPAVVLQ
jgi:pimeloyl-ACP methyl ester carboxylesterase